MCKRKLFALLLVLCLGLTACAPAQQTTTAAPDVLHTVDVRTVGGDALEGATYYVYKDTRMQQKHDYGTIGSSGQITFMAPEGSNYVLKLEGVEKIAGMSEGYNIQPSYTITSTDTKIVLTSSPVLRKDPLEPGKLYQLGDIMRSFTVKDTDGNRYALTKLLETKKCVVINFWFVDCGYCQFEFPFLQADYEKLNTDDVAFIALSPIDSMEEVAAYKAEMGLTFPMGACDARWGTVMSELVRGYPTTMVIDRYGRICMAHAGAIPQEGVLETIVNYFTADDYQQVIVPDMVKFLQELTNG